MDTNMPFTIKVLGNFSLTRLFPDDSLIFSKIPDISLTAVKFRHFQVFQTSGQPVTHTSFILVILDLAMVITKLLVTTGPDASNICLGLGQETHHCFQDCISTPGIHSVLLLTNSTTARDKLTRNSLLLFPSRGFPLTNEDRQQQQQKDENSDN